MATSYLDLALDDEHGAVTPARPAAPAQQYELIRSNEVRAGAEATAGGGQDDVMHVQARDKAWIKERMKSVYALIKEALREGYLGPAQCVGADVVQMVEGVAREGGDVARACRLASREGAGNDVAAAALLSAYEVLCRDLAGHGVDVFRRRAAVALMVAEAARVQAEAAAAVATSTRGRRPRRRTRDG